MIHKNSSLNPCTVINVQPLQSIPAEKVTKKPIPEEHQVLKNTFEGLIQKCLAAAADPVSTALQKRNPLQLQTFL